MKLSFVIPAYNEEKFIGRCLESVLAECGNRRSDIEIIVVNNTSADRTREVASAFPGVRVVDEPKKGLVNARRAGFLVATGDVIANVDADTILTNGWVEKVFKEFTDHPRTVGFSGPFIYYDLSLGTNLLVRTFYYFAYIAYLLNRFVFRVSSMLQGGNFVFRKSAFEKIGGYSHNFTFYGEDADVAKRLHKVGDVVFSFSLPIYASGRRLKGEGLMMTGLKYSVNYFWTNIFKKPFNKNYRDIRP